MVISELPGIRTVITHTYRCLRGRIQKKQETTYFPRPGCKMRQRQPVVQWQPIINPMRWQNSDEARAHLSTTRFHMQAAASSSHRSCRFPILPYQSLARSSGGEITGSEQSVRQKSTTGPPHEECPLAHTRRVNIATVALPAGGPA